jgi:outer membrane biosynthesis protein TonB
MVADRKVQQFPVRLAMAQAIKKQREFPLPLALLISVALHGLLLLISLFWVPFSLSTPAAQEPEESVLRFAFAPTEDAEQDTAPQGDVPFETPPQQPETVADYEPSGLPSLLPPSSPAPPVPELEPSDEERPIEEMDEPIDEEQPIEEPAEAQQEAETEIPEFPTETDAPYRADPDAERSTTGSRQDEQLDLGQAIRDFSDAVARARASNPPSSGGGSPRNVFVPDPGDVPTTGFGVGNLMFESRDYDWTEYARSIYWEIWKAWHRRLYHTTYDFERWGHEVNSFQLNHQVQVRFVIEASGQVTEISIEGYSGCPPLDASATDALAEVVLQPLPADFPRDREVVHARFIAIGHIMGMRQTLRWLRYNGYF